MNSGLRFLVLWLGAELLVMGVHAAPPYTIASTGQTKCYDNAREILAPEPGRPFYGQHAQRPGIALACRDNGDGTMSDLNVRTSGRARSIWMARRPASPEQRCMWPSGARLAGCASRPSAVNTSCSMSTAPARSVVIRKPATRPPSLTAAARRATSSASTISSVVCATPHLFIQQKQTKALDDVLGQPEFPLDQHRVNNPT
jgi:hypothetical protein